MVTKAEIILAGKDQTAAMFASASRSFDSLKRQAASLQTGIAAVGPTLAGVFALVGAKGALDMLDTLDDLQEKTGISVEKLSELRFAGESVGTPLEALATGVQRLSKLMSSAAGGNKEAASTFKTLGVEVKSADGALRNSEDVLGDLADRFSSYEDGAAKAALAQGIFGKSGAEMIPLLNQGREGIAKLRTEAEQLGAIYGGDLAKQAADFNDNLTKLQLASEAAAVSIGGPLLRSLSNLMNQYLEIQKIGATGLVAKDAFMSFLDPNFGNLSLSGEGDVKRLMARRDKLNGEVQRTLSQAGGSAYDQEMAQILNAPRLRDLAQLGRFLEVAKLRQRIDAMSNMNPDDANDAVSRRFLRPERKGQAPVLSTGGAANKKAADDEAAAKRYIENLTKQTEKAKELSQVEMSLAEIQRIRVGGGEVTEVQKQQILLISAEVDHLKESEGLKKQADDDQKERQRRFFADQDAAKRIYEETLTPLEAYNAAVAHLSDLKRDGFIASETYRRAIAKEGDEFRAAEKRLRELGSETDEFSKRAAESIQDSLGRGLSDALDGQFKDIGKSFLKMIRDMVAQAAAARISRAMFGDLVKGGEGDGIFGQLLRAAGGALLGGGSTPGLSNATEIVAPTGLAGARADGGPVAAGKSYLVGERGHEVFVPKSDGSIIPNHELGLSGSLTVNNLTNGRIDMANLDRTPQGNVLTIRQVDDYMSRQLANPNSQFSKALAAHTGASRKRD